MYIKISYDWFVSQIKYKSFFHNIIHHKKRKIHHNILFKYRTPTTHSIYNHLVSTIHSCLHMNYDEHSTNMKLYHSKVASRKKNQYKLKIHPIHNQRQKHMHKSTLHFFPFHVLCLFSDSNTHAAK